jgi:para-nitrobenzyl esterase
MAVFGIDLAGQIQKLRRERRFGLGLIKLLYPGVKGDEELGRQVCRDMAFTTMGYVVMQAQQRVGGLCWRYWFDYVAEAEHATYINGAWHGNEVPYVFDTLGRWSLHASMSTNGICSLLPGGRLLGELCARRGPRDILPGRRTGPRAVKGGTFVTHWRE